MARQISASVTADTEAHGNSRDLDRRLRIGYVSGDFRRHSCASFLRPLFAAHDSSTIEIVAYSDSVIVDEITNELRGCAALWRPVAALTDSALAELVRRDQIDILVDLAGHTA
jgi:predicted O-linked N-acetylglucosamine transferase (SPINDLY family)